MDHDRTAADAAYRVPPGASIGHVHLKVADLDRALAFYHGVLGFELTQRYGRQAAFLSASRVRHKERSARTLRRCLMRYLARSTRKSAPS